MTVEVLTRQFRCFWHAVFCALPLPSRAAVIPPPTMKFSFYFLLCPAKDMAFLQAAQHGSMQLHITQKALKVSVSSRQACVCVCVCVSLYNDTSNMCDSGVVDDVIGH